MVIQGPYVVPPITIFPETNAMNHKNASLCYTHANMVSVEGTEKAPHITSRLNLATTAVKAPDNTTHFSQMAALYGQTTLSPRP